MILETCGIPTCADLAAGKQKQQCVISSFSKPRSEQWQGIDTDDPLFIHYTLFENENRIHNPLEAKVLSRMPYLPFRFEEVDGVNNIYRIVQAEQTNAVLRYITIGEDAKCVFLFFVEIFRQIFLSSSRNKTGKND